MRFLLLFHPVIQPKRIWTPVLKDTGILDLTGPRSQMRLSGFHQRMRQEKFNCTGSDRERTENRSSALNVKYIEISA